MPSVERLEQITEAMERAAADAVAPLLEERGRLIAELSARTPDERTFSALRRAAEAGERLRQRLMVDRARRRDELGQLYHAGCLARALAADRAAGSRVDCQG